MNSDDNISDLLSEEESTTTSVARPDRATLRQKRKERSPQETAQNLHKKINMGEDTKGWIRLEEQLDKEEEEELKSLSPELAKVTKILLRRNEQRFSAIQNDITSLLRNAELLQTQQTQIETLKHQNLEMHLKCDKMEKEQGKL